MLNILTNDDYLPGSNTSITDVGTGSAGGEVLFDAATGEFSYTPLLEEAVSVVTVDYSVCHTGVTPSVCRTARITISVQLDTDGDGDPDVTDPDDDNDGNPDFSDPNPLMPTVADDVLTVVVEQTGMLNILTNDDYLPSSNTSILATGTGSAQGEVRFEATTGEFFYTAIAQEAGTVVTVNYTVCHTGVNPSVCRTATITISVQLDADGDTDGDGIPDSLDLDDDNDGIPDIMEQKGNLVRDTDGDGTPDHKDLDADADGLKDVFESDSGALDANNDGVVDNSITGSGANGLFDGLEEIPDNGILNYNPIDTDADGIPDFQDVDDDGDGIGTIDEFFLDCDEDNIPDHLDLTNCNAIPNAFSPNGDGINDTFLIRSLSDFLNFKIEIFNRWGNKVYNYSNNGKINPVWWDGFSTGKLTLNNSRPLPVGTYWYVIDYNNGIRKPIAGWVYLNR